MKLQSRIKLMAWTLIAFHAVYIVCFIYRKADPPKKKLNSWFNNNKIKVDIFDNLSIYLNYYE